MNKLNGNMVKGIGKVKWIDIFIPKIYNNNEIFKIINNGNLLLSRGNLDRLR